jgi:hypothetical protein
MDLGAESPRFKSWRPDFSMTYEDASCGKLGMSLLISDRIATVRSEGYTVRSPCKIKGLFFLDFSRCFQFIKVSCLLPESREFGAENT